MDCRTARLLLPYFNLRAEPLPAELAADFEAHASQCSACTTSLQNTGREDRIIAVAMKDVEIPEGLKGRLLTGLRRERARRRRNWPLRHPRWSIAAALLICLIGGALGYWWQRPLPALDLSALAAKDSLDGQYQVEALFAEHGIRQSLPNLPYRLLVSSGMEMIQGKLVPRLRFEARDGQFADVYILTNKDFDLSARPAATGNFSFVPENPGPNPKRAFLVRHSGGLPNWLFSDSRADA
jgi:hypothetical protein